MAMGDVDELNSLIGLLISQVNEASIEENLRDVQHVLFNLGGELSLPGEELVSMDNVEVLESLIDGFNKGLPPLKEFVLPGGSEAAALCHLARAVCRRAERSLLQVAEHSTAGKAARLYMNRLSDLLFVMARLLARRNGGREIYWDREHLEN